MFVTSLRKSRNMEKIKGLIDAPFTPMLPNGEVNYEPIQAYSDLLVSITVR